MLPLTKLSFLIALACATSFAEASCYVLKFQANSITGEMPGCSNPSATGQTTTPDTPTPPATASNVLYSWGPGRSVSPTILDLGLADASPVKISNAYGYGETYLLDSAGRLWSMSGTTLAPLYAAEGPWKDISGRRAVKQDGTLWEWGNLISSTTRFATGGLTQVGTQNNWVAVHQAVGTTEEAAAINSSGQGCFWGWRSAGAAGGPTGVFCNATNDTTQIAQTTPVCSVNANTVYMGQTTYVGRTSDLAGCGYNAGWTYSCTQIFIGADVGYKKICTWQDNIFMGSSTIHVTSPSSLPGSAGKSFTKIVGPSSGPWFALATDGTLLGWGSTQTSTFCNVMKSGYCSPNMKVNWPALLYGKATQTYTGVAGLTGYPGVTPVNQEFMQVGTAEWADVATDGYSVLAVKTDGSLWSWGDNSTGQLGLGDTTNRTTPTRVGTSNKWLKVFIEGGRSFGLQAP